MGLLIGTLCLNEMQWLPTLYDQHKNWSDLDRWVFVEAADKSYSEASPDMVTSQGLSVDGTSEWLADLAKRDSRVTYIPHGFSSHSNPAQGKCAARNRYLQVANETKPEFVWILDADEYYTKYQQVEMFKVMRDEQKNHPGKHTGFIFGIKSIWRPPTVAHLPLFTYEAIGCLWSVCICRGWLWVPGMMYTGDHNSPCTVDGKSLADNMIRIDKIRPDLFCFHMGYAALEKTRQAKIVYYEHRGEGKTDHRQKYVDCRRAFNTYQLGDSVLPHGAKVQMYRGPIPEVFMNDVILNKE